MGVQPIETYIQRRSPALIARCGRLKDPCQSSLQSSEGCGKVLSGVTGYPQSQHPTSTSSAWKFFVKKNLSFKAHLTRKNNFQVRLLVGCDGLRVMLLDSGHVEQVLYYASHPLWRCLWGYCPALSAECHPALLPSSNPMEFIGIMLGMCWIDCEELQSFCVNFLDRLRSARIHKLSGPLSDNSP